MGTSCTVGLLLFYLLLLLSEHWWRETNTSDKKITERLSCLWQVEMRPIGDFKWVDPNLKKLCRPTKFGEKAIKCHLLNSTPFPERRTWQSVRNEPCLSTDHAGWRIKKVQGLHHERFYLQKENYEDYKGLIRELHEMWLCHSWLHRG